MIAEGYGGKWTERLVEETADANQIAFFPHRPDDLVNWKPTPGEMVYGDERRQRLWGKGGKRRGQLT